DLAREVDDSLGEGVYMQFRGPSYETPAEVQMARIIGASLIGMSTALEAIAAREAGMDILGISLVTNLAAGISPEPLSHEEVLQAGKDAGPRPSHRLAEPSRRVADKGTAWVSPPRRRSGAPARGPGARMLRIRRPAARCAQPGSRPSPVPRRRPPSWPAPSPGTGR